VRCLGTFSFRADGAWTTGPALKRGRELLQFLFSSPHRFASRDVLAEALWPDLDGDAVPHRLHLAVSGARAALRTVLPGAEALRSFSGGYGWDADVTIVMDVDNLLAAARMGSDEEIERAVDLYRGEFLAGEQAEWIYPMRVRCANAYASMLERLATAALQRDDIPLALERASRLISLDRAHEGATRLLMTALARCGRRAAALTEYDALARYLDKHLGLEPSGTTMALRDSVVRS
jgi:DNA-binding SARP family transcriptional activator